VTASQRWIMLAAILGSAMVFLDSSVVNLALPRIGRELSATYISTLEGQTYVVSGYLASLAALLILAGALADYHGRRRVFAIGLGAFAVTSLLCGLAPNLELLVVFRILQGAAGALLVPGSLAILTTTFEGAARARSFGIWAAATSAAGLVGPVVGGILVDGVSWRMAFLVPFPLLAVALYATLRHMPESRDESSSGHFDWLGATVAVIAVGGLAFGAIRGQDRRWADPLAWAALGVGAVALVAFPILMARRPYPLVPLGLFRLRRFATINLSTLLIYGALYTMFTVQALFLQGVVGYSATAAGLIGVPTGILLTVLSTRVGALVPHDRAAADGRRPALARARAGHDRAMAARARGSVDIPAAAVHARRHPPVYVAVRGRHLADRRAADLDADVVGARAERGHRVGDQQRDQPDRAAAALGDDLRARVGVVLRGARVRGPGP